MYVFNVYHILEAFVDHSVSQNDVLGTLLNEAHQCTQNCTNVKKYKKITTENLQAAARLSFILCSL